jgi:ribosomal protein S12 methylthiotransferase accessory factor
MIEVAAALVAELRDRLERDCEQSSHFKGRELRATEELVRALFSARRRFGIKWLGSVTRLYPAGVAVAQVVRPLPLSNAVAQGKGVETGTPERIPLVEVKRRKDDWEPECL